MAYETWYEMYTKLNDTEKRAGQQGLEHIGLSGPNSVIMMAQLDEEEKSKIHIKLVREMAATKGMQHEIYKLTHDGR